MNSQTNEPEVYDLTKEESFRRFATHDKALRLISFVGGVAGLLALGPLMAAIAAMVRYTMGRPALYRQERVGKDGSRFVILKFRTMSDAKGPDGSPLPDAERLGRLGSLLRSTSLDELPGLLNILKGDMNLVGPRPLLPDYLPLYTARQARRHEVLPGLTGWNAVNGRNNNTWEEQFEMDVWYVDHRNLLLDLKILCLTLVKVLQRDGVTQEGHATRERFRGSQDAPSSTTK